MNRKDYARQTARAIFSGSSAPRPPSRRELREEQEAAQQEAAQQQDEQQQAAAPAPAAPAPPVPGWALRKRIRAREIF